MSIKAVFFASIVVSAQFLTCCASGKASHDSLPLRCTVSDRTVISPQLRVTVAEPFRYVGGQRFRLNGDADAEQHLFVVPGAAGEIKELLWLQFEQYLPDAPGTYDYESDQTTPHDGLTLHTNIRRYTALPQPGSDRERAFQLLTKAGYRVSTLGARVRLVHLLDQTRRAEVMAIYAVPATQDTELTAAQSEALVEQALRRISFARR